MENTEKSSNSGMEHSEITLNMLSHHMPGAILVYKAGVDGKILFAGGELALIFECASVPDFLEYVNGSFRGMVCPDDIAYVNDTIFHQIEHGSGGFFYVKYRAIAKNGMEKHMESWGHLVYDDSLGELFYVYLHDEKKRDALLDITFSLEAEKRQREKKLTDNLTGLLISTSFALSAVAYAQKILNENGKAVYVDITIKGLEEYQAAYGYNSGDRMLVMFAKHLKELFPDEPITRTEDHHFILVSSPDVAESRIEELNRRVRGTKQSILMEVKAGGCIINGTGSDINVNSQKDAMERAKFAQESIWDAFGVHFRAFDEKAEQGYRARQYVAGYFEEAMRGGNIHIHYQPIIDAKTKEVISLEALTRWSHQEYGMLGPGEFLSVLEEQNKLYLLDMYVIEKVCAELKKKLEEGGKVIPISINLSASDFEQIDIVQILRIHARKNAIPPEYIHIELSEREALKDINRVKEAVKKFREDGFQVWMDDFGSGALGILKDMDIDGIKIDMKLVQACEENQKTGHVIKALIDLSKTLHVQALAKGVEEHAQLHFLRDAGCDMAQGYLIGKPAPAYQVALPEDHILIAADDTDKKRDGARGFKALFGRK